MPEPNSKVAAFWYRQAIAYLPRYVHARVHLAEIFLKQDQADAAETLLRPALSSCDPEIRWRMAEVLIAQDRLKEAETLLNAAQVGFEALLAKHLLAYADHAAEFYVEIGNDCPRALELARANAANRPTRRAIELVHTIVAECEGSIPTADA